MRPALLAALLTFAVAAPALAQDSGDTSVQFTLGRVLHATPDKMNRIAIRSVCAEAGGCSVSFTLTRTRPAPVRSLGGNRVMLLGNTTETDYVTLSKRTAAALRKRSMKVTLTAEVADTAGNRATFTKVLTLGPKKRR